ncbi:rhodanese-like domain-containing protein [Flavobacterium sp.]|uniref:rhodanese-like domain-containing protein n=1 Tax=Flavobacterium sp. TaxID=239 RepID=UPI002FD95D92
MKKYLFLLLFVGVTLACNSQSSSKVKVVSKEEFKLAIQNQKVQLVDVRTAEEYADGAIVNAQNIDVLESSFETKIQKLDKTQPVYIYCRSGSRSQTAAQKMIDLGFTQVIDLKGGYLNWN